MRLALAGAIVLALACAAAAQDPGSAPLDDPDAFERGFAVSLYQFDACGDAVAGRMFRRALGERFSACPFSPDARARYERRTRAEQAKVRRTLEQMVETNGGLPMRLEGMASTCRELQASDEYRRFRSRLEQYAQGSIPADAVLPKACDAADVMP